METQAMVPIQIQALTMNLDTQDLLEAFMSGKSKRTIEAYRKDLEDFGRFLKVETVSEAARILLSDHGKAKCYRTEVHE